MPRKKTVGFLEFMTTLPGFLAAVAAIITAIGGLYIALRSDSKPPNRNVLDATSTPPTNVANSLVEVTKGKGQVRLTDRFALQLVDVETLKGKSKKDAPSSHEFNKKLDDKEHVFKEVLSAAGVSTQNVLSILEMNQEEWEGFLDSLDEKQRDKIKQTPFAKFNVYVDGNKDETYSQRFYFLGEALVLGTGTQSIKLEITNIFNTKSLIEPESVKVRFQ